MPWPDEAEVTSVERHQLGLVESLHDGPDGRVHEPDVGVGVTVDELSDPSVVSEGQALDEGRRGDDQRLAGG